MTHVTDSVQVGTLESQVPAASILCIRREQRHPETQATGKTCFARWSPQKRIDGTPPNGHWNVPTSFCGEVNGSGLTSLVPDRPALTPQDHGYYTGIVRGGLFYLIEIS
jgi:hypothetical protein